MKICDNDSIFLQGLWQHNSGMYFDTLYTVNSCDSIIISTLVVTNETKLHGSTTYSGGYIGMGDAKAILYKSGLNGHHQLMDSVFIGINGTYEFNNIPSDNYYLYVKLNNHNSPYQHIHNTYYDSTFKWQNAQVLNLACGINSNITVHMYETLPHNVGNGRINGSVSLFSTDGGKTINSPIQNCDIYLIQVPNNNPIAYCLTETSGFYNFRKIPEGSYSLYVDIPGFPMVKTYFDININLFDTLRENLNFYVDTSISNAGIYTDVILHTTKLETPDYTIELLPNPLNSELSIVVLNQKELLNIEILNINAQSLYKSAIDKQTIIDMSKFISGLYFIKFQSKNNIIIKKIIKQ